MLLAKQRYAEAIAAFQTLSDDVAYQWRIVDCYLAMEQPEDAIEQLRKIATTAEDQAPKAAYRIACIYREAEEKEKCVATLRKLYWLCKSDANIVSYFFLQKEKCHISNQKTAARYIMNPTILTMNDRWLCS